MSCRESPCHPQAVGSAEKPVCKDGRAGGFWSAQLAQGPAGRKPGRRKVRRPRGRGSECLSTETRAGSWYRLLRWILLGKQNMGREWMVLLLGAAVNFSRSKTWTSDLPDPPGFSFWLQHLTQEPRAPGASLPLPNPLLCTWAGSHAQPARARQRTLAHPDQHRASWAGCLKGGVYLGSWCCHCC